jgi:hypothetical protein
VLVYASDASGQDTYPALAEAAAGRAGRLAILLAVSLGCLGFITVYIDIIGGCGRRRAAARKQALCWRVRGGQGRPGREGCTPQLRPQPWPYLSI